MKPGQLKTTVAVLCFLGLTAPPATCQAETFPSCASPFNATTKDQCCNCQLRETDSVYLCEGRCADGYYFVLYNDTDVDPSCKFYFGTASNTTEGEVTLQPTTSASPTSSTLTLTKASTTTDSTSAASDETQRPSDVINVTSRPTCKRCHEACATCNGSGPSDCEKCAEGYQKNTITNECVKPAPPKDKDKGGPNIVIIAGAAGGGAGLLIVVVVVVVCCCRARRRKEETEEDEELSARPGLGDINGDVPPEPNREEKCVEERSSLKESGTAYVNVPRVPRRESIQRSHDKVTRYTRDPTTKVKPPFNWSASEEKELKELPVAPSKPEGKAGPQPPLEQYEIVESDDTGFHVQPSPTHQPHRAATTNPNRGRHHQGGGKGPRRKTGPDVAPYPAAPVSMPTLPSQTSAKVQGRTHPAEAPEEDYINMEKSIGSKSAKEKFKAAKALPTVPSQDSDDELEDYENAAAIKTTKGKPSPPTADDQDDDQGDYENTGPKGSLLPRAHKDKQFQGRDNVGATLPEEPQEIYGNQDAIAELERQEQSGVQAGDDDQPPYTNENHYQNIFFEPKQ